MKQQPPPMEQVQVVIERARQERDEVRTASRTLWIETLEERVAPNAIWGE